MATSTAARVEIATIGRTLQLHGEIEANEDLYLDGEFEGTINLNQQKLIIGVNGRVNARITAREVVVMGTLQGRVRALDRVEIKHSGAVTGELVLSRISIEDGAYFKGTIDIQKTEPQKAAAPDGHAVEVRASAAAAGVAGLEATRAPVSADSSAADLRQQRSLLDRH